MMARVHDSLGEPNLTFYTMKNELKSYVSPANIYGPLVTIYINLGYSVVDACDAASAVIGIVVDEICKYEKSHEKRETRI